MLLESGSKKTLSRCSFGGFTWALFASIILTGNKRADRSEGMYCPRNSKGQSENSIVSAFFRVSLVNESAGYNQRPAGYNQRPLVNFRCGLGGPQKPERRSTRSIVAFERHTARVLPATIAEIRFRRGFSTDFRKVLRIRDLGIRTADSVKMCFMKNQFCEG